MTESPVEVLRVAHAEVMRTNDARWKAGAVLMAAVFAATTIGGAHTAFVAASVVALMVAVFFGWALPRDRRALPENVAVVAEGELVIDADRTLRCGGKLVAKKGELTQGFVEHAGGRTLLRLERRDRLRGVLLVRIADMSTARAALRALALDADQSAVRTTAASAFVVWRAGARAMALGPMVLLAAFASRSTSAVSALVATAVFAAYVLVLSFWRTTVRIGTDGLSLRWIGRERFIPLSSIRSASAYDEFVTIKRQYGVELDVGSGKTVRIATGHTAYACVEAERLLRRIDEVRAANGLVNGDGPRPSSPIARGEEPLATWVAALRAMGQGARHFRQADVPTDALLRVVEDGTSSAIARAGAALAAVESGEPSARARVRLAAGTTVSPRLAESLARIAESRPEDDDEHLASLVEDLDETRAHCNRGS